MSGVDPDTRVLNGGHVPQGKGMFWGIFFPMGLNGVFEGNLFNMCVKSWQYFRMENI